MPRTSSDIPSIDQWRRALEDVAQDDEFAVEYVERLLAGAWALKASDVHLESRPAGLQIKARLDGMLHPIALAPLERSALILTRLKYVAKLAVYQQHTPQDGRLAFDAADGATVDMRVSFLPTVFGEKAVVRLPEPEQRELAVGALGMPGHVHTALTGLARRRQGLLLLTGPSSSGKTTTIYALLKFMNEQFGEQVNIASIEDPVEQRLEFLSQTQVNPAQGLDFAEGLKSILRQDPDIIVVGETRDEQTAGIAMQAALTGHLVLSTVHSPSAVGVFLRLLHMELEPYLIASAVSGVLAQRLVRRLCPDCRKAWPREDWPEELARRFCLDESDVLSHPAGCAACDETGFRGRTGLFSLVTMEPALQDLILARATAARFDEWTRRSKTPSLLDDGLSKARAGVTSLEEVSRVLGC